LAALAVAAGVRIALAAMHWPVVNSDEGTLGLMAWHIAEGRDFPAFFYGQHYMGAVVAYAAAPLFWLAGPSPFGLRLVTIALFLGFLAVLWKLAAMLYDRRVASVSALLLAFGSIPMLAGQLQADGHNATRLLAVSMLLLAVPLARAPGSGAAARPRRRWLWAGWGLVAGIGIWTDLLVAPFLVASAAVLLACRRRGRQSSSGTGSAAGWAGWALAGLLLGISPMVAHHLLVPHASTVSQVLGMVNGQADPGPDPPLGARLSGAITVSLPMATGASALCADEIPPVWRMPALLDLPADQCSRVYGGWGLTILVLLVAALWGAVRDVRAPPHPEARRAGRDGARRRADALARLALVGAATATLGIYALSAPAATGPHSGSKYLQTVWLGLPAVVAAVLSARRQRAAGPAAALRRFALTAMPLLVRPLVAVALCGTLLLGTAQALSQARQPHFRQVEQQALRDHLLAAGRTRVYTDYWTCDALAFTSGERIVCAVLDDELRAGFDRVGSYRAQVAAARQAWYVFRAGSPQARRLAEAAATPVAVHVAGYVVFRRTEQGHQQHRQHQRHPA
jgi:hypothetical protein